MCKHDSGVREIIELKQHQSKMYHNSLETCLYILKRNDEIIVIN